MTEKDNSGKFTLFNYFKDSVGPARTDHEFVRSPQKMGRPLFFSKITGPHRFRCFPKSQWSSFSQDGIILWISVLGPKFSKQNKIFSAWRLLRARTRQKLVKKTGFWVSEPRWGWERTGFVARVLTSGKI